MPDIKAPSLRNLQSAFAMLSNEKLQQMRRELENEIADNSFYNSTAEAGRSSSQEQLSDVHFRLRAVFHVLGQRGQLTKAEIDAYRKGVPKTAERIYTPPSGLGWN